MFQDTGEPLVFKDKTARVDLDSLYDPCFLLHLFGELTRPGECAAFYSQSAVYCCHGSQVSPEAEKPSL